MQIAYRDGRKEDALRLAELIDVASGGVVEYLFHDLVPGVTPVQVLARVVEDDQSIRSYKSAIVAEYEGKVVGMSLSYPSRYYEVTEEMRQFFPPDRLEFLGHFFEARVEESWLLDALAVDGSVRKHGVGAELISRTKARALANGFAGLSLIAFADNAAALPLYKRVGFEIVQHLEIPPHELIPHEGGCFLMKCDLSG